jgi:hypothetical protein
MHTCCPKCGHAPLPVDQSLPAACGGCGVILAKIALAAQRPPQAVRDAFEAANDSSQLDDDAPSLMDRLLQVPDQVDPMLFWGRSALFAGFAVWGWVLVALDVRTGEMNSSFIHRPLLIFHEAGHVIFMILGGWMTIFGGTLGQLVMPLVMAGALLLKNRDTFGAAIGLWLFGVSLLDVAPYLYDALEPQLMLLNGQTGEAGGHDWIFLLSSMGLLAKAQTLGLVLHKLAALVVIAALVWAAWVLKLQYAQIDADVIRED